VIRRYSVTVAGQARAVELEALEGGRWRVVVDGRERTLDVRAGEGSFHWLDGTTAVQAAVDGTLPRPTVTLRRQVIPVEIADARAAAIAAVGKGRAQAAGPATVRAPIPGRVARVLVKAGEAVTAGKGLVVLEAMKMENEIRAPRDGVVKSVACTEGTAVEAGQTLVVIE
jgi:biotin carboxyl carrier protein